MAKDLEELDLAALSEEAQGLPSLSPIPLDLAKAVISDLFRTATSGTIPDSTWMTWQKSAHKLWQEQLGMVAHLLMNTQLRDVSLQALAKSCPGQHDAGKPFGKFMKSIEPLTAEMIRSNAVRREELLRNWAVLVGATIAGEDSRHSAKRLKDLDYRKTLKEYERAAAARKKEAKERARKLREAQARQTAARGWRE